MTIGKEKNELYSWCSENAAAKSTNVAEKKTNHISNRCWKETFDRE